MEVGADHVTEDHRIRHLHHGCLQVDGEQHVLCLRTADLGAEERVQRLRAQYGAVDNLALQNGEGFLKNGGFTVRRDQLNPQFVVVLKNHRLLVVPEIIRLHCRHIGL